MVNSRPVSGIWLATIPDEGENSSDALLRTIIGKGTGRGRYYFRTFLTVFLLTLEEEKTEKRKEQKRKSDRKAYRKKVRANGFAPVKYRKGGQKLTRA